MLTKILALLVLLCVALFGYLAYAIPGSAVEGGLIGPILSICCVYLAGAVTVS